MLIHGNLDLIHTPLVAASGNDFAGASFMEKPYWLAALIPTAPCGC
jgi:hypothetical protein